MRQQADPNRLPELIPPPREERAGWKKVIYPLLAAVMIIGGIIGQILPIVPGIPFSIAGLVFLAFTNERARRIINRLDRKLTLKQRMWLRRSLMKIPIKSVRRMVERTA